MYLANQVVLGNVKELSLHFTAAEGLKRSAKLEPGARDTSVVSNPIPAEYEVTPQHAENVKAARSGDSHAAFQGLITRRGRSPGRQADVEADPAGGDVDLAGVPRRRDHSARHVDAADRKHDPPVDLLQTP